ncbi:uncharacterized protein LOC120105476 [Phoenix dactylifera]|uniref:Uncharacterized protein LOC120105476 n=1 Tax=Phoenix dactylifera TaxID=42345 RepID=A0A8B8ZID8_PHODC|nr:uncharacterized protein LOC120105476 [Phoenix dactylifera]
MEVGSTRGGGKGWEAGRGRNSGGVRVALERGEGSEAVYRYLLVPRVELPRLPCRFPHPELEYRPLPIVLATFSGGSKGCMYMVLQLLEGECGGQVSLDDISL